MSIYRGRSVMTTDCNPEIRLWSPDDLRSAVNGDPWLGTLLLNAGTYLEPMWIAARKLYNARREYCVAFSHNDCETFYAIDDASAARFALAKYIESEIDSVAYVQRTEHYTEIDLHPERGPYRG